MHKKGQLTFFIILGIIILTIVMFSLYLRGQITETDIERELGKIGDVDVSDINYFVITCMDRISSQGIDLISRQGGFIFKDQRGLINWELPYEEYENSRVGYQIYSLISRKFKETNVIENPPLYPCYSNGPEAWKGLKCQETYDYLQKQYFFGTTGDPENNLNPDLCKDRISSPGYTCSCANAPDSLNCKFSIQAQLEDYITKNMEQCLDFSDFPDYEISTDKITTNITFGIEDTIIKIDLPVTIYVKGEQPIVKILSFSLPQKIRLKSAYQLSRELIKRDIDDISFDMVKDGQEIANVYKNMQIDVDYRDGFNVVIINDSKSRIDGKSFVFMFARENRFPALDYYTNKPLPSESPYKYDIYVPENENMFLGPVSFDPDDVGIENSLIYYYEGWKSQDLENSKEYLEGENCTNQYTGLKDERRCANYKTGSQDVGEHELTLRAEDSDGKSDSQKLRILVDDTPKIVLKMDNTYLDIPNHMASVEDPFVLDADQSFDRWPEAAAGDEGLLFRWTTIKPDNSLGLNFDWSRNSRINFMNENIQDISGEFNEPVGNHKLILEIKNQAFTPVENIGKEERDITVAECLPHRNENAPYPFNEVAYDGYGDVIANPFQADHACCNENSQITSGNICYNLVDYGCLSDFSNKGGQFGDPGNLRKEENIEPQTTTDGSGTNRDVYKRTLIRKCSGNRGNICDGNVRYKVEFVHTCEEFWQCRRSLISETDACQPTQFS